MLRDWLPIGVLGGTGPQGRGLALRWAVAGLPVFIGSRDSERAVAVAGEMAAIVGERGGVLPTGGSNADAAAASRTVVLAVPYGAQAELLEAMRRRLEGKILIDVAVPLAPPDVAVAKQPPAGSAAAEAQALLGERVRVVAAFQNVAAGKLLDLAEGDLSDVLVCANDRGAAGVAIDLAAAAGTTGYDAGPLDNAYVVDGLTAVLIGLNRRYGSRSAGIRLTNLPRP